jgi:hypothetical protein
MGIGTPSIHNKIPRPINPPCYTQIDFSNATRSCVSRMCATGHN